MRCRRSCSAGLRVATAALPVLILFRPPAIAWYWTLGIGLTQGTIQMSLVIFGMEFGMPAGLSSLLLQSQVFFTTIFAFAILRERPGRAQYAGIAVSGAGIAIIGLTLPGGPTITGLGFVLAASVCWACSNMIIKLAGTDDLLRLIAWAHLIGVVPLLGLSYVFEGGAAAFTALADISWVTIGELFFLGLIATCFGFMLWSYLLRQLSGLPGDALLARHPHLPGSSARRCCWTRAWGRRGSRAWDSSSWDSCWRRCAYPSAAHLAL